MNNSISRATYSRSRDNSERANGQMDTLPETAIVADAPSAEDRRYPRVSTPIGVWVQWQLDEQRIVSRVRDLNVAGVFIATPHPVEIGMKLRLLFSVPEGEIRTQAIVRNMRPPEGMGVEFTSMDEPDSQKLLQLIRRLLEKR